MYFSISGSQPSSHPIPTAVAPICLVICKEEVCGFYFSCSVWLLISLNFLNKKKVFIFILDL